MKDGWLLEIKEVLMSLSAACNADGQQLLIHWQDKMRTSGSVWDSVETAVFDILHNMFHEM